MDGMQVSGSDGEEAPESPLLPPSQLPSSVVPFRAACEACRSRKIRCDRESPCLQCQRAGIECIRPADKPREKRARILLTPQYERKIDLLDHRLDRVTQLLEDLKTRTPVPNSNGDKHGDAPSPAARDSVATSSPSYSLPSEPTTGPVIEGESSLLAHSLFVNSFVQRFVQADALGQSDPEMSRTIKALSHIVSDSKQQTSNQEQPLLASRPHSYPQQERYALPPIQKAVALIRVAKAQRLAGTGLIYEFLIFKSFGDLCLEVYFSESCSPFDFISVNAGLYSLFWDYARVADISQDEKNQCIAYSRLCRENLETGLANLPLYLPARSNVIAALLFGAFYALEFSKSLLCWSLSCKASELCQTLGYHRAASVKDQKPEDARYTQFLFWTTYYIDKSLSLRLGRASTIPDWAITIDLPSSPSKDQEPVLAFFILWIKAAKCQGNIYEMLYSPESIVQPDHVRQSRVNLLVSSLGELERDTRTTRDEWLKKSKKVSGEDLMDFYTTSDETLRLSLLTHVYRAAPRAAHSPLVFSVDCIKAARATLENHHECISIIRKTNDVHFSTYIHWTLLFAPFVPFIVIFCHVMETQDQTDLARLNEFVNSIQSASTVSEPAGKLHQLFHVLYNIAARYIELRAQQNSQDASVHEMDTQLATLGLPYTKLWSSSHQQQQQQQQQIQTQNILEEPSTDFQTRDHMGYNDSGVPVSQHPINPVLLMGNGLEIEDWLYSNQAPMELLQDTSINSTFKE